MQRPPFSPRQLVCLALLVCPFISVAHSMLCYCTETGGGLPPFPCIHNLTCSSSHGCYLMRFYSDRFQTIVQRWDCIDNLHNIQHQLNYTAILCDSKQNSRTSAIHCCFTDFCNNETRLILPMELEPMAPSPTANTTRPGKQDNTGLVGAITVTFAVTFLILLGLLTLIFVMICLRKRRLDHQTLHYSTAGSAVNGHNQWNHYLGMVELSESGSSSDLPYTVVSDIKDVVKLNYQIGMGKFGTFYHGCFEGVEVALKKFDRGNRSAWFREALLYNRVLQTHENILTCFVCAMASGESGPELWLATRYHELGSLQDYLRQRTVSSKVMLQMTASVCNGLAHLHSDSSYNQAKLPVAHCNLTSRNILVKSNLSCCIGDFRLAVFKHKNEVCLAEEIKLGTVRYMAPEVLNESLSLKFESFKQVDVYTLGLVLWEICQRKSEYGDSTEAYQVPFQGLVPPEPSMEDMRRVVVMERKQPTIPSKWNNSKLLSEMTKVMRECWYYTSTARPTAVYLKKKLLKMSQELEKMNYADQPTRQSKAACAEVQCVSTL